MKCFLVFKIICPSRHSTWFIPESCTSGHLRVESVDFKHITATNHQTVFRLIEEVTVEGVLHPSGLVSGLTYSLHYVKLIHSSETTINYLCIYNNSTFELNKNIQMGRLSNGVS